jgi:hypothetical protein
MAERAVPQKEKKAVHTFLTATRGTSWWMMFRGFAYTFNVDLFSFS